MRVFLVLTGYAAIAVLFFFLLRHFKARLELDAFDVIGLSVLWPLFLLLCLDWGVGDLLARVTEGKARRG